MKIKLCGEIDCPSITIIDGKWYCSEVDEEFDDCRECCLVCELKCCDMCDEMRTLDCFEVVEES